mgnify:CR=1 FL=1
MTKHVLLLGKKGVVVADVVQALNRPDIEIYTGTSENDVLEVFSKHTIDTVIMGAGLDIEDRLTIIRTIFAMSDSTTIHMKDFASGQQGMMPFVQAILTGLDSLPT